MKVGDLVKYSAQRAKETVGIVLPSAEDYMTVAHWVTLVQWSNGEKYYCASTKLEVIK
jgi:hypothetical protein